MCRNLNENTAENDEGTIYCIYKNISLLCDGVEICRKSCYKTFLMRIFARRTFLHVYIIMSGSPTFDIEKKQKRGSIKAPPRPTSGRNK